MPTKKPPLESRVLKKILMALRARGGEWDKTHGSPLITRGTPDIIGCYLGYYVAFEVKRDAAGKLSPLQAYKIKRIREAGGIAEVIYSVGQAMSILQTLEETRCLSCKRGRKTSKLLQRMPES